MRTRPLPASVLLILAAVVSMATAAQEQEKPRVVQIVIAEMTYKPLKTPLKVGDIIEWVNEDVVDHTATAKNKDWDVVIRAGRKVRMPLKKAGVVEYFCKYHPNMTGKLTVK